MSYRDLARRLRRAGCSIIRSSGRHEVWECPCGKHHAPVPNHGRGSVVAAGTVRSIITQLSCLPPGVVQ
ncbi:type II toxin-antitoxin system HicA family toxin [Nocardioides marmotae]